MSRSSKSRNANCLRNEERRGIFLGGGNKDKNKKMNYYTRRRKKKTVVDLVIFFAMPSNPLYSNFSLFPLLERPSRHKQQDDQSKIDDDLPPPSPPLPLSSSLNYFALDQMKK